MISVIEYLHWSRISWYSGLPSDTKTINLRNSVDVVFPKDDPLVLWILSPFQQVRYWMVMKSSFAILIVVVHYYKVPLRVHDQDQEAHRRCPSLVQVFRFLSRLSWYKKCIDCLKLGLLFNSVSCELLITSWWMHSLPLMDFIGCIADYGYMRASLVNFVTFLGTLPCADNHISHLGQFLSNQIMQVVVLPWALG